ncbi:RanBP2-type zinc finger protein, partial [Tanacetum coccineum]
MPPYDGTAYHYNYNNLLPGGNPYRPLQLSATPAYSGGLMIGTGALYGLPQLMEQFGLRLPNAQVAMGPRPGFFPEEPSQKKDGTRENDWECPKCGNVNFSFRTVCNMRKCNTPKPGSQVAKPAKGSNARYARSSWIFELLTYVTHKYLFSDHIITTELRFAEKTIESLNSPTERRKTMI